MVGIEERVEKERKKEVTLERDSGPKLEERKEDKDKRKVEKETIEYGGIVETQVPWRQTAFKEVGAEVYVLWTETRAKSAMKHTKTEMSHMRGVCWRRVRMNSGIK